MASVGRGRGYLGRHHAREEAARPGEPPKPTAPPADPEINGKYQDVKPPPEHKPRPVRKSECESDAGDDEDDALAELLLVDDKYVPVLHLLEQFSPGEDGIIFNCKLKELESMLNTLCQDDAQLLLAFCSLRAAALANASTARKLATVGACFTRQQRQNVLRRALLNMMQTTFSKLELLERNPQILSNAATLMGDYFTEARLANGSKVHVLCAPLLQYLRALLASNDRRAHRALATQLMQNGQELLTTNAQELDELSINIRRKILTCAPSSIVWLMLCADLCVNKFQPLPVTLQTFYASNLDLLPAEENKTYNEVTYGSWKKEEEDPPLDKSVESVEQRLQVSLSSEEGGVRRPRPILGAGARMNTSVTEASPPTYPVQEAPEVYNKSALAKRYDLNSWRQQEEDKPKEDDQETFHFDVSKTPPKYYPNEDFSNPPPFVDGKFTAPPPFMVDRARRYSQEGLRQEQPRNIESRHVESRNIDQRQLQEPARINQDNSRHIQEQSRQITDRQYQENPRQLLKENQRQLSQDSIKKGRSGLENSNRPGSFNEGQSRLEAKPFVPGDKKYNLQDRLNQHDKKAEEINHFNNAERQRKPPENWRDKSKDEAKSRNWGRQKSSDGDHKSDERGRADEKVKNEEKDDKGPSRDSRSRRRDGRPKKGEEAEGASKTPQRRHAMEVPRGKFWDHDDRLDKDY